MGYMRHHAIIVTNLHAEQLDPAHEFASKTLGLACTEIIRSPVNGYRSFMVVPDGSKEGWADSDLGDDLRERFIEHLDSYRYEDGSISMKWACVQYGDDEGRTLIVAHSEGPERSKAVNHADV